MVQTSTRWASGLASRAAAWGLALVPLAAAAQTPVLVGPEFQVNTYTPSYQRNSDVAAAPDGSFVVVWDSVGSSGSDNHFNSIQGRRYASDGSALGAEVQINAFTSGDQFSPSVAMTDAGDFVVVWVTDVTTEWPVVEFSVQGQRFAADGSPQGTQFKVNTVNLALLDYETDPSVAAAADGSYIVVWQRPSNNNIVGRRFASDGSAQGAQFKINTLPTGGSYESDAVVAPNGDFIVVWSSDGSPGTDTSGRSVQGQRYASDGSALGGQFQVNTYTTQDQGSPAVGAAPNGDFLVAWASNGSSGTDTSDWSIQGRRYAADGSALGGQFQINSFTTNTQNDPSVATSSDGGFIVVWRSGFDSPGVASVRGQRLAASGFRQGAEFQINTYTTGVKWVPEVAAAGALDFVVAWQSYGSSGTDTNGTSIQGQRFRAASPQVPALSPSATLGLGATLMLLTAGLLSRRTKPARPGGCRPR